MFHLDILKQKNTIPMFETTFYFKMLPVVIVAYCLLNCLNKKLKYCEIIEANTKPRNNS